MKSLSELTQFYYEDLHPVLQELDKKRRKLKSRVILIGVIFLFFDFAFFSLFKNYIGWLLFLNVAIGSFLYRYLTKDFTEEFKDKIIRPLVGAMDKNLRYTKDTSVPEFKFINSGLFTSVPDKYEGKDYITGKIDGVKVELSTVYAQKKDDSSDNGDSWNTIFHGLFIVSEFNKKFTARTVVLPDSAQNSFGDLIGNWLQSHNTDRDNLVKMDNPEFEKEFVVYGSDQIEARYILNHSLMKRLLEFKKRSKHKLYVSFAYSSVYIAIDYGADLFAPSVFKTFLDYKVAMEYVGTLHMALSVVDELKLNNKIWSKE